MIKTQDYLLGFYEENIDKTLSLNQVSPQSLYSAIKYKLNQICGNRNNWFKISTERD